MEGLDELANDIRDAYEEECRIAEQTSDPRRKSLSEGYTGKSIRDLNDSDGEENDDEQQQQQQQQQQGLTNKVTRKDMLGSWLHLIKVLSEFQVFLQYTPLLENLFRKALFFDETKWETSKTLVDLMTETVENNDKGGGTSSTDCRYVTLLEILGSFAPHWEISHQIERCWISVGQHVDPSLTPEEFRRDAFSVLMSLSWVPKSPGLYALCGIESVESASADHAEAPSVVQSIFYQIRSTPLPRHDCVHRILSRLKEGPNVTVAISSPHNDTNFRSNTRKGQGLGKTTLAAMVTSHPAVQSNFTVLWLRLNKGVWNSDDVGAGMTYQQYTAYLDSLCEQLDATVDWPKPVMGLEEPALKQKKEEEKMFQVKREMSDILQQKNNSLLMVLDDVFDDQEIEWFWFQSDQSVLVTTQSQTLGVDWTLELEMLSELEALELFLTEADYPPNHVLSTSLEAKSIVQRCGYHPLTIRTAARWFRLKQVTAGVVKGLEELSHELNACTAKLRHSRHSKASPENVLTEIMNLMLSPVLAAGGQPTTLMKMCLSSMATVFPTEVPLEAVHLLWGQLLRSEPLAVHELGDNLTPSQLRKRVRFISEALTSLGLFSITEKEGTSCVEIHHEMQTEYALSLAREMQFSSSHPECTQRWHAAFATAYLAKKVESDRDGVEDICRNYALENLLGHMLKAHMFQKVAALLRDDRFLSERLDHMGFIRGTETHIKDCRTLQAAMESDETITADPVEVAVSIYSKSATFIADYAQLPPRSNSNSSSNHDAQGSANNTNNSSGRNTVDAAKALHMIGTVLADLGKFSDAVSQYKFAMKLAPKASILAGTILYSLSSAYIAKNDCERGLKNLKECLKVMKESGEKSMLYADALMLKGDALVTECDYKDAMESYDKALDKLFTESQNCRVEIGIALGRKGRLQYMMGEVDGAYESLDECLKWKDKIRESSCDLAMTYNFLGDLCLERSEKEKAMEFYDQAYRTFEHHRSDADEVDIHILNGKTDSLNGDIDGCQESFELALEAMARAKRMLMERTAYDLRIIGRTYMNQGDYARAMAAFNHCMEETRKFEEESLERSAALFDMGNLHLKRNETDSAFQCFEQSLKIRIVKVGPSEVVIETLEKIGSLHKSVGENEDAMSFFNKALELTERVHGEHSFKVASLLFSIAEIKEEMNEDVEALAMFEECLELRRSNLAPQDPDVACSLVGLGNIHLKLHNHEKSYQCFVESLEIRQTKFASDNPFIGESFQCLGVVSRKAGDCERALQFLLEALHIRKGMTDKSFVIMTLLEIGNVHRQLGDPESATGCFEKCLEIILESYGPEDERIGDVLIPLGHVKKSIGQYDNALEFYDRALTIREKKFGKDHTKVAAAHRSLGMIKFEKGDYLGALRHLSEFARIQEANKQKNTVDYVIGLQIVGDIHKHNQKMDAADSAYSAALHAYNAHQKEIASRYPALGPMLESRIASRTGEGEAVSQLGFFSRITGELGRLNEEVKSRDTIDVPPEEIEFRRKILYDA